MERSKRQEIAVWAGAAWLLALCLLSYKLWYKVFLTTPWDIWLRAAWQAFFLAFPLLFQEPGIIWGLVLLLACEELGRSALTRLLPERPPLSLCAAFGLVLMALMGVMLGFAGLYKPVVLVVIVCVLLFASVLVNFFRMRVFSEKGPRYPLGPLETFLLAAVGAIVFITALNPTLFYDALYYHLPLPSQYLLSGSTAPLSWHWFSYYPSNAEVLLGEALAGGGVLSAQVFSAGAWLVGVLALRDLAVRFMSPRAGAYALFAGAFSLTFALSALLVTNDTLVLLFSASGLYCLLAAHERAIDGELAGMGGWLMCWAVLAGGCAGVKYTSWVTVAAFQGIIVLILCFRAGGVIRRAAPAFIVLMLVLCPWIIRNVIYAGNPVMPVPFFGFTGMPEDAWNAVRSDVHWMYWRSEGFKSLLSSPWSMVFSDWSTLAKEWGTARFIGPLLWMGAPLLLLFRRGPRAPVMVLVYGLCALLFSLVTAKMIRFAYPGLGAIAVMAGTGLFAWSELSRGCKLPRSIGFIAIVLAAALCMAMLMRSTANLTAGYRYPRADGDLEAYMGQRAGINSFQTSTIPLQIKANQKLPENARVLMVGETRFLYLNRPCKAPSFVNRSPLLDLLKNNSLSETSAILADQGITHVLVSMPELERLNRYGIMGLTPELQKEVDDFVGSKWCPVVLKDDNVGATLCRLEPPG